MDTTFVCQHGSDVAPHGRIAARSPLPLPRGGVRVRDRLVLLLLLSLGLRRRLEHRGQVREECTNVQAARPSARAARESTLSPRTERQAIAHRVQVQHAAKWEQNGNKMPRFLRSTFTKRCCATTCKSHFIKWSHFYQRWVVQPKMRTKCVRFAYVSRDPLRNTRR